MIITTYDLTHQAIPLGRVLKHGIARAAKRTGLAALVLSGFILTAGAALEYLRLAGYMGDSPQLKLRRKLITLLYGRNTSIFMPRKITVPGKHYASKEAGVPGFREVSGFSTEFTPAVNVFSSEISVMSVLGVNVNVKIRVSREDDDYLLVQPVGLRVGEYHSPVYDFVDGDVATLGYMSEDGARVQVQASPYVGCDLSLAEYEEMRFRVGAKPNMGYMEFIAKGMAVTREDIPRISQALKEERRVRNFEPFERSVVEGGSGDVVATILESELDVDLNVGRPAGKILPALYDQESVVYAVNKSAEARTFSDRIEAYVHEPGFSPPDEYKSFLNDFVQALVPPEHEHSLGPESLDSVLERQSRPAQRKGYEQVAQLPDFIHCEQDKMFQKNEVYPEFKCPRGITNPNAAKRVMTATFVGPLTEYLKKGPLRFVYGFGDANHLQDIMLRQELLDRDNGGLGKFLTDATKMDATVSTFFRRLEMSILKRLFRKNHHESLSEIHAAQYAEDPKSKFGNPLSMGDSRRSGEGGTSTFNTLIMVFVFFCWLRIEGASVKEAMTNLGIVGGDDGAIVQFGSSANLEKVASDLGLILKIKAVTPSMPWEFLGITKIPGMNVYFPDVVRFCSKIPYSHVKNVPVDQILYRKCEPYVRLYPNVPLVGNLARAVLRILDKRGFRVDTRYEELCRSGKGYVLGMLEETQLPGPRNEVEVAHIEAHICAALGCSITTLRDACNLYDSAQELHQFPQGFLSKDNMFIACEYELLFRDLYIPGHPAAKTNLLPAEALLNPAAQQVHGQTKNYSISASESRDGDYSETDCCSETRSQDSAKSAKSQARKNRQRRPTNEVRNGLSEDGSVSSRL